MMGGANSEVTDQTANILLEAASFKPVSIHSTGDALGLPSEARYRFERGIASGLTLPALKRATQLIAELGGGKVCQRLYRCLSRAKARRNRFSYLRQKLQTSSGC